MAKKCWGIGVRARNWEGAGLGDGKAQGSGNLEGSNSIRLQCHWQAPQHETAVLEQVLPQLALDVALPGRS